jgi:hypothetical protein
MARSCALGSNAGYDFHRNDLGPPSV